MVVQAYLKASYARDYQNAYRYISVPGSTRLECKELRVTIRELYRLCSRS